MSINPQLQEAYRLIRDNRKPDAMRILVPIVKADANNADAWWLLANAVPDPTQARRALEQVLRLRPGDEKAQKMLDRVTGGAPFAAAPPRQSFSGVEAAPRDSTAYPPGRDPFGIPPADPAGRDPFAATSIGMPPTNTQPDPFASVGGGSFGGPGSGSSDPFGVPPSRGGRGAPAPGFAPQYAPPPKQGGGCRVVMIGCGVIALLCIVSCVASLFFAGAQIRTVIDEISTQNPEVGGALSGVLGAVLQGNTPDPAILRTLEASGLNITIDPAFGSQLGTLTGGDPLAAAGTLAAGGLAGNAALSGLATQALSGDMIAAANTRVASGAAGGDPLAGITGLATQAATGGLNFGGLLSGISAQPGAPLPSDVQMRGAIEPGQDVTGQLAIGGAPQGYTLRASRGTVITVTVTATGANNTLDPLVALYGADGTQLAFNDDSEGLNSRLEFTIPVDGTYTIAVSSFMGGSGGQFTLRVQQG